MPSLYLPTMLCFEPSFASSLTVNIQKTNAFIPWTPCFKIKEASIKTLEDKIKIISL